MGEELVYEIVPSADQLAELETKHGRVGVMTDPTGVNWCVVLRKPNRAEYKRYRAFAHQPARVADAQETLLRDTCVYSSGAKGPEPLEKLLDEWPGIAEACGGMIMALAGMAGVEQGKA